MTLLERLTALRDLGVTLPPWEDRLRVDAPAGVLTDAFRHVLQAHKPALLDLGEAFEERAGMMEHDAGLERPAADALVWECVMGEAQRRPCGYVF